MAALIELLPSTAHPGRPDRAASLPAALLREGLVDADQMVQALCRQSRRRGRLVEVLLARNLVSRQRLYSALSRHFRTGLVDPAQGLPDVRLLDRIGATRCLQEQFLPLRIVGGATLVATARPEDFETLRPELTEALGPVVMAIADGPAIEAAILRLRGPALAERAETRVASAESCRGLGGMVSHPLVWAVILGVALATLWRPDLLLMVAVGWVVLTLLLVTLLKIAAGIAGARRPRPETAPPTIARLPVVSVMVALYREDRIAPRLVRRLGRLDYPEELLDIVLIVEASDQLTRKALPEAELPAWMRVVVVPDGRLKTKPRALNFALDHCRGSIVGVYDAEDAPAPDQIRKVVDHFYQRGPEVACLQGVLDFYNPSTNWLSRCFTIEYATWFRLILPGLERLGLPIPLGGTTLFFRRQALEDLGGWDAHNVTEDADLGMRLARHGYRTELVDTVTEEEANCRAVPWIKQRSRWIKGYMMTWATHMRDPRLLWRQLGAWRFAGFQILFLCTLSQFILAPVLWSFWLVLFDLPHPVADALPKVVSRSIATLFLLTEIANVALGIVALGKTRHRLSRLWVPTLHFYHPLATLAAAKAAWEMLRRPFYWDKTAHGAFDPPEP